MNDLPFNVKSPILLFADDTSAIITGGDLKSKLIETYKQAAEWFEANGLLINQNKTQAILYSVTPQSTPPEMTSYCEINNSLGVEIDDSMFLGARLDKNLYWKQQIDTTVS